MNYKKLLILMGLALLISSVTLAQEYKYIGAAKCKMCHNKPEKGAQFDKWAATPHAKTMSRLNATEAKDPKCLKCHSTAKSVDASLVATLTPAEGVSCETCHGPGSIYKAMNIMKDQKLALTKGMIIPDEKMCKKCHNQESPHYKGFDFAEYMKKVQHDDPTTK